MKPHDPPASSSLAAHIVLHWAVEARAAGRAALAREDGAGTAAPIADWQDEALRRLQERIGDAAPAALVAEVSGAVEYRLGEGMTFELRRGRMHVLVTSLDTVFSWTEERYRGEAAIPLANLAHYVRTGAIRLLP
jgi:glutathione S-transferase